MPWLSCSCGRAQKQQDSRECREGKAEPRAPSCRAAAASTASRAQPQCPRARRTHILLIKALPSQEHLHVLAEGEGPVVLAEAVEQLGILVVQVLVTDCRNTGHTGLSSAGCCLQAKSCQGFVPRPSLCPSSHGTIGIRALGPQKLPAREHLKLMLLGEANPKAQTLAKMELGVAFCPKH